MMDNRTRQERYDDAAALQALEGNPLDAEDHAMFAMFEREGWSTDQCIAYIREEALKKAPALKVG